MKTLSYFLEIAAELDLALNLIVEKIPCLADWYPFEDEPYLVVTITCREEDAAYVEKMLAPFV